MLPADGEVHEGSNPGTPVLGDGQFFLSTVSPDPHHRQLALGFALASAALFLVLVPFAKVPLPAIWAFIPLYQSALLVTDLITAVLLFGQFHILRAPALLLLGSGYLFTAGMILAHTLTFPGLFTSTGLLGAGMQSTAWLYMFWHGGFPLCVLGYTLLKDRGATVASTTRSGRAVMAAIIAVLGLTGLTLLATLGHDTLPAIMQGHNYTPAMRGTVGTVWALSLLALALLWWRRPHTVLDLWLMVVLTAWLADIGLAAVLNHGRFDLGFYAGRLYGFLAASFVLTMLLVENTTLYATVVGDVTARKRAEAALREANTTLEIRVADRTSALTRSLAEKDAALASNQALLREVHHRVKNNLQMLCDLIYLQLEAMPDREHQALHDVYGRIYAIARLHEQLYQSMQSGGIVLAPYLARVIAGFEDLYPAVPVKLETTVKELAIDLDRAIHVGLIVNELITNAVKHAFPKGQRGEIVVALRTLGDEVQLEVRDNGIGLSAALDLEQAKTLGLRIVRILAKRLDATVNMDNKDGATFTITFPLHADVAVEPRPE